MKKITYLFLFFILLTTSCKRQEARWDIDVTVPLFNTSLSLDNLDRSGISYNASDSSYTLVYDNIIYSTNLTNVKVPDTSVYSMFTLGRLKLADRTITQTITLAQMNPAFLLVHGTYQDIPAQDLADLQPQDIDASEFFETATLDSGYLDVSITNDLPVTLSQLIFEIRNASDNSLVAIDTFNNLSSGNSQTHSVSLAGKTVNKQLKGKIVKLTTLASPGKVLIDAYKGIALSLKVRNLRPKSATAIFPNQTVYEQNAGITMDMGGAEVKRMRVKSGNLGIKIVTTIQENMTLYFSIPSATKNGQFIDRVIKVPGGTTANPTIMQENIPMAGYELDYRGVNPNVKDTINTFHQIMRLTLDSSGRQVSMSLKDSIQIYYGLTGMTPDYVQGYFGNQKYFSGPSSLPISFFKGISGNVDLKDFKINLKVSNGIGALGRTRINKLESINTFSGKKVTLVAPSLSGNILLNTASDNPFTPYEVRFPLTQGNSNIKEFAENIPNAMGYDIEVETNPLLNNNNWKDFVYDYSKVVVSLNAEVPASFRSSGLVLMDTLDFDLNSIKDINRVKAGKLKFYIENGYPYNIIFQAFVMNPNGTLSDSVMIEGKNDMKAGNLNNAGYVTSPTKSTLFAEINTLQWQKIRQSPKIILKATVYSAPGSNYLKIYQGYKINVKVTGDFKYETGF